MTYANVTVQLYYPDHGCHLHPSCLNCPREQCIHDEIDAIPNRAPNYVLQAHGQQTTAEATRLRALGRTHDQIALEIGISRRAVFNALRRGRIGGT